MIVFASHNNTNLLDLNLERLCEIDLNGHDVLFIDTGSTDEEYIRYFDEMKKKYSQFMFIRKDNMCWDTGAYLHAYRNYVRDRYIFLQDSIYISSDTFIKEIDEMLDRYEVVPIFDSWYTYDSTADLEWVEDGLGVVESRPLRLYFGPMFATRRSTMDKIPNDWHREPHDKVTATRMERRWALMFHLLKVSWAYYHRVNYGHFWQKFPCTQHKIRKIWMNRLIEQNT